MDAATGLQLIVDAVPSRIATFRTECGSDARFKEALEHLEGCAQLFVCVFGETKRWFESPGDREPSMNVLHTMQNYFDAQKQLLDRLDEEACDSFAPELDYIAYRHQRSD